MSEAGKSRDPGMRGLLVLAGGVVLAWLLSWLLLWQNIPSPNDRGVFGDMFGAVNSLFSGLAFAGVVFTIFLQKRELSLQREEMHQSRLETSRMAQSGELSARLAALSQLITYYEEEAQRLYAQAFRDIPDMNAPGGRRRQIIDPISNTRFDEVSSRHQELLAELEAVYNRLPPITGSRS